MTFKIRQITICTIVAAMALAVFAGAVQAADQSESELIAVLTSADSAKADKAITCKKLAIYGTKDAVPALAKLLPDPQLTSWARTALEVIPGPEADKALRAAVDKTEGRTLVGVINSIAVRGDAGAVAVLVAQLASSNADVASAAAVALGRIGTAPAVEALEQALADGPGAIRSAVAEGCILAAERLQADGKTGNAAGLYSAVRKADVPKPRIVEATRGVILAQGQAGIPLLIEQLRSDDKTMFNLGLTVVREVSGEAMTRALAAELEKATADRQALLVLALADRDDAAVLPAVLQAVKSDSDVVRAAAVDVLQRVGDASSVPVLLDIAVSSNKELAEAAKAALEGLGGDGIDEALGAEVEGADTDTLVVLIELAGRRRISEAVPQLLEAAGDTDPQIRAVALIALGETIGPESLSFLVARVATPMYRSDIEVARKALLAAAIRMPDREACAGKLVAAMTGKPVATKCALLEIVGAVGGDKALVALGTAGKDRSNELQDTATRLLGNWMTVDGAPVLLDLAKNAPGEKYRIRAMRGYIRLARQFAGSDKQRAEMFRTAMATAERDAEKQLVLSEMPKYPSVHMLRLAADLGKNPAYKNAAARAALVIAQKVGGQSSINVQQLLSQIGHDPVKIEIIKAVYGAGTQVKDVTKVLQEAAGDLPLITLSSTSFNSAFGGDPAPGTVKQLKIEYRIDGKPGNVTVAENGVIMLPVPR